MTFPPTKLVKKSEKAGKLLKGKPQCQKSENFVTVKWKCTWEAKLVFQKPTTTIGKAPIRQYFDVAKPIILQTDASGFVIAGLLNEYDYFLVFRQVGFCSQKFSSAEHNEETYGP